MKNIVIYYWDGKKINDFSYEHQQKIPYSAEKRNEIVDEILNKGYNLMIRSNNTIDVLVIYISKYSFGQR